MRSVVVPNELAADFARTGQLADGLTAAQRAMEQAERTGARSQRPESLRIRGELPPLQAETGAPATAEDQFRQALDWARRQRASSWELRAVTSFAQLKRSRSSSAEARTLLQSVYDRFTEGFDTPDLKAAKSLLDTLEPNEASTRHPC
jgi:hypothetical protein